MENLKKDLFEILDDVFEKNPNNVILSDMSHDERIMHGMGHYWDMAFCKRNMSDKNYRILTQHDLRKEVTTNNHIVLFCELINDVDKWGVYSEYVPYHVGKEAEVIFVNMPYQKEEEFTLEILPKWINEYTKRFK